MKATTSASCSMEPDSRRSLSMRPLVVAASFTGARELRERDDGHVQFLGHGLQAARNGRDFLRAVFVALCCPAPGSVADISCR